MYHVLFLPEFATSAFQDLEHLFKTSHGLNVPVDGRVEVRVSGTFLSELLRDQVASSFPPCWTNDKEEGYASGLALRFAPTTNTSVLLHCC